MYRWLGFVFFAVALTCIGSHQYNLCVRRALPLMTYAIGPLKLRPASDLRRSSGSWDDSTGYDHVHVVQAKSDASDVDAGAPKYFSTITPQLFFAGSYKHGRSDEDLILIPLLSTVAPLAANVRCLAFRFPKRGPLRRATR